MDPVRSDEEDPICEKPLAYTLREADAPGPDPRLQLGYTKLCDPAVRRADRDASGDAVAQADRTFIHQEVIDYS